MKRLCCRLHTIPSWIRLVCGVVIVALGLPIFVLPIPLGLALLIVGLTIICSAISTRERHLFVLKRRAPVIYRAVKPFLERCDRCPPAR